MVSINSTSEEVRRLGRATSSGKTSTYKFPLIQLPRKSEDYNCVPAGSIPGMFPLIQLPRKSEGVYATGRGQRLLVSINSTSEEVRRIGDISKYSKVASFH